MSRRSRLFVSTQVKDWGKSPLSRVPDTPLPEMLGADLWLDASDTTTITAAGGAVSQWNNKGSLGNFTQATGAVQPTTGASTLNGLNVIDFASDHLTAVNTNEWKFLHDGTDYIIAMVVKPGNVADPNALLGFLGNNGGGTTRVGFCTYFDDRTSASKNNRVAHYVTNGSGNVDFNETANDSVTANAFNIVTVLADPNNGTAANRSELFTNAGTATKNNTDTGAVSASNPTHVLRIGAIGQEDGGPARNSLTGSIAEIVIVSGANATETNRVTLRDYLNGKWGVY